MAAGAVRVLLLDADGNLFPSEEPAFEASTGVTNGFLAEHGISRRFAPDELRRVALGRNFRATVTALADAAGVTVDPQVLERWVAAEKREVSAHLAAVLRPDPRVAEPLARLARRHELAAVSSSALSRLAACFAATGLDALVPPGRRFSAEDSLPAPASKPDPAVYLHAARVLGIAGEEGLAVEDAVAGVRSAVAAGFATVGNLHFVAPAERAARATALREAGAVALVTSWWELDELLSAGSAGRPEVGAVEGRA